MNAVARVDTQSRAVALEQVLITGDLAKLTPDQRVEYYHKVCESTGLNPLTQPFAYITLNGKLTLYALRACTDQLRQIHNISVEDMTEIERDGVCIVTVKVRNAAGRTDMSKGAVHLANLKGEALANAIMKAETKAKRRATLSICGLALLDELEVETIPNAVKAPLTPPPAPRSEPTEEETRALDRQSMRDMAGETADATFEDDATEPHMIASGGKTPKEWGTELVGYYAVSTDLGTLMGWRTANEKIIDQLGPKAIESLAKAYKVRYDAIIATMGPAETELP